jgi:hypothetical protein
VAVLIALGAMLMIPVGGAAVEENGTPATVEAIDYSALSSASPDSTLRLLFIHHSCGGHWLADPGRATGEQSIYEFHPYGGGLRRSLQAEGYEVHEASYGSDVGEKTDIFDWPSKFDHRTDKVLSCDRQDRFYADGRRNQIVVFKSCYPNNLFEAENGRGSEGMVSGSQRPARLTLESAKAAYAALLPEFRRHPEVLFVAVTAPPLAPRAEAKPLWKRAAYVLLRRPGPEERLARSGVIARKFNNWLKARDGWLATYPGKNVAVFDLYDVLTDEGVSDFSRYATGNGSDSHPSRVGNEKATKAFVPFLNRAVRRAGLVP